MSDLSTRLFNSQPRMHADDTRITYAGADLKTIQSTLNFDYANGLFLIIFTFNISKTEFMLIRSKQKFNTLSGAFDC